MRTNDSEKLTFYLAIMTKPTNHIINKIFWNCYFSNEEEAFAQRGQLQNHFEKIVVPPLNKALDQFDQKNKIIHIDRLELKIDFLRKDTSEHQLYSEILKHLKEFHTNQLTITDIESFHVESYLVFLKTGQWHFSKSFESLTQLEVYLTSIKSNVKESLIDQLKSLLPVSNIQKRFIYQHSDNFFYWTLNQLYSNSPQVVSMALKHEIFQSLDQSQKKDIFLQSILKFQDTTDISDIINWLSKEAYSCKNLLDDKKNNAIDQNLITHLKKPQDGPLDQTKETKDEQLSSKESIGFEGTEHKEKKFAPKTENISKEFKQHIVANAGILLLHPFIPQFFVKCNLLDSNQKFKSLDSQIKAVFILHFLATGTVKLEEHQSIIYKLFSELDFSFPIPNTFSLTKIEKEECEILLKSAISHWSALKNTSPEGLRETFLQREGKLEKLEKRWNLIIEQKTLDILLSKIPWAISIIKFPWMKKTIWVEWA